MSSFLIPPKPHILLFAICKLIDLTPYDFQSQSVIQETTMLKDKPRKNSPTFKVLHFCMYALCAIGFAYGSLQALLKYLDEPLSSTTTGQSLLETVLPSISICRFDLATYNKANFTNTTLEEMRTELSMGVVIVNQG